jgi:hypothetical protein
MPVIVNYGLPFPFICPYCSSMSSFPLTIDYTTKWITPYDSLKNLFEVSGSERPKVANPNCRHCLGRGVQKWILPNGEKKTIECKCVKRSLT